MNSVGTEFYKNRLSKQIKTLYLEKAEISTHLVSSFSNN